jgi:probable phosphoglycerate mutase
VTRSTGVTGSIGGTGSVGVTRFIVVRHGQTEWNVASRIQGHRDSALTEEGVAQARAIGRRLASEAFDVLVSSDLGRAFDTARCIAEVTGHEVLRDARLRERNFGLGEGLTYAEIDTRYPAAFSRVGEVDPDYVIPEGESRRAFHNRVRHAFEALAREHPGRRLAVVSHGGVLAALYRHIHAIPVATAHRIAISNASYNAVAHEPPGAWTVEAWDDTDHLGAAVPFEEA